MDDASLFRFPPGYRTRRVATAARLVGVERRARSADRTRDARPAPAAIRAGGFGKAVEMCNNNGHCRKFDAGTMCPSYRVTRDEQHTRRAGARTRCGSRCRAQLGADDARVEAVRAALDLCVSCKGCRRECPTGVDMAKMKIEALAARAERQRHRSAATG